MTLADHFKAALPDSLCDISTLEFDTNTVPGPRSVIASLLSTEIDCIRKLYSNVYPQQGNMFLNGQISISSTYRKYCSVKWKGKMIVSTMNRNAKNPYVYVKPPFTFRTMGFNVRLTEIQFFLIHSVKFPGSVDPVSHLLACGNWPMVHPNQNHYGKPVEVLCRKLYESNPDNTFFLASSIESRAIIFNDQVHGERVLTAVSLVE